MYKIWIKSEQWKYVKWCTEVCWRKKKERKNNFSAKNGQFQSSIISKLFGISTRSKRHFVPLGMIYLYTKFQNCAAIRKVRKKVWKITFWRLEAACNIGSATSLYGLFKFEAATAVAVARLLQVGILFSPINIYIYI